MLIYNGGLIGNARHLRNNMTDAERRLWSKLRLKQLGWQFSRQRIIGNYIVDFLCHKARLVIEVDGSQHYDGKVTRADKRRDEFLEDRGFRILRFSDNDVLNNNDGVVEKIIEKLGESV